MAPLTHRCSTSHEICQTAKVKCSSEHTEFVLLQLLMQTSCSYQQCGKISSGAGNGFLTWPFSLLHSQGLQLCSNGLFQTVDCGSPITSGFLQISGSHRLLYQITACFYHDQHTVQIALSCLQRSQRKPKSQTFQSAFLRSAQDEH